MPPRSRHAPLHALLASCGLATAALLPLTGIAPALGQLQPNAAPPGAADAPAEPQPAREPMGFITDSPGATEALRRAAEQVRANNLDAAASQLRSLLTDNPHALVPLEADPDLHLPVRTHVRRLLATSPGLTQRMIDLMSAETKRLEDAGDAQTLDRNWFFTPAGQRGSAALALSHLSAGRIDAAGLVLADLLLGVDGRPLAGIDPAALASASAVLAELGKTAPEVVERCKLPAGNGAGSALGAGGGGSGAGGPATKPSAEAPGVPPSLSALGQQPAAQLAALAPMPLGALRFEGNRESESLIRGDMFTVLGDARLGSGNGPLHRVFPIVVDKTAFVAGTRTLVAAELPTLRPRWSVDLLEAIGLDKSSQERGLTARFNPRQSNPLFEEISSVTYVGRRSAAGEPAPAGMLIVVVSYEDGRSSTPVQIIVGVDAGSGQLRWAQVADQLDKNLESGTTVRGEVMASGDGVVLALRKYQPERRLGASYLAGLDAWTGAIRWSTSVTSAGVIAPYRTASATELSSIAGGILYRADKLGAVYAYQAHDGRPIWVRRVTSEPLDLGNASKPFMASGAVLLDDGTLVCQSADRRTMRLIEQRTGALIGKFPSTWLDTPLYLLKAPGMLVGVAERSVCIVNAADLPRLAAQAPLDNMTPPDGAIRTVPLSGIRGGWARAAVSGRSLLVPDVTGLSQIDLAAATITTVGLDASGNPLVTSADPSRGAILLASDSTLFSMVTVEEALTTLRRELALTNPGTTPAVGGVDVSLIRRAAGASIKLARLATRIGRPELLAEAIASCPRGVDVEASRRLVFDLGTGAIFGGVAGEVGARISKGLSDLASGPTEQGAAGLAEAKLLLTQGSGERAFARCQQLLTSGDTGSGLYRGDKLTFRIGDEARRLMAEAFVSMPVAARATVESQAAAGIARAVPLPTGGPASSNKPGQGQIDALVEVSRLYPLTRASAESLKRAAEIAGQQRRAYTQATLLRSALAMAVGSPDRDAALVRSVADALRENLLARSLASAAREVERLAGPGTQTAPQPAAQAANLSGQAPQRLSAAGAQALPGWYLATIQIDDEGSGSFAMRAQPTADVAAPAPAPLLMRHDDGRLGAFAAAAPGDVLSLRWSVPESDLTDVVLMTSDRIVLLDRRDNSARALDVRTGEVAWKAPAFANLAPPPPAANAVDGAAGGDKKADNGDKPADNGPDAPNLRPGVPNMNRRQPSSRGTLRGSGGLEDRLGNVVGGQGASSGQPPAGGGIGFNLIEPARYAETLILTSDGTTLAMVQRSGAVVMLSVATGQVLATTHLEMSLGKAGTTPGAGAAGAAGGNAPDGDAAAAPAAPARPAVPRALDAKLTGGVLAVLIGFDQRYTDIGGVDAEAFGVKLPTAKVLLLDQRGGVVRKLTLAGAPSGGDADESSSPGYGNAWGLRSTEWGEILVMRDRSVECYNPELDGPAWVLSGSTLPFVQSWVVGPALVLMDNERRIWMAELETGTLASSPLAGGAPIRGAGPTVRRIDESALAVPIGGARAAGSGPGGTRPGNGAGVAAGPAGGAGAGLVADLTRRSTAQSGPLVAISTSSAILLARMNGELVGADGLESAESLLGPVQLGGSLFTLEGAPARTREDQMIFSTFALEPGSARCLWSGAITLPAMPTRTLAYDGRLVVTAGSNTAIYRTEPLGR